MVGKLREKLGDDDAEIKRRFRAIVARKGNLLMKAGVNGFVTFGYETADTGAEEEEDEEEGKQGKRKKVKSEDDGAVTTEDGAGPSGM